MQYFFFFLVFFLQWIYIVETIKPLQTIFVCSLLEGFFLLFRDLDTHRQLVASHNVQQSRVQMFEITIE